jgi:hypothetical protein
VRAISVSAGSASPASIMGCTESANVGACNESCDCAMESISAPRTCNARGGKRRYPLSVDQTRFPTHVIDMQVGADDEID